MTSPDCANNDVLDAGTPTSAFADTVDAGTPTSTFSTTIDGGAALGGLCPPLSTVTAAYGGVLGDGGTGHSVLIHDRHGTPVIDIGCRDVTDIKWTRELSQISQVAITVGPVPDHDVVAEVDQWVHHVTVYRNGEFVWTGVVLDVDGDGDTSNVVAIDYGGLGSRTRTQFTKSWSSTDPVTIAGEVFSSIYQWHVLPGGAPALFPSAVAYDYSTTKDAQRADQALTDLVKLGVDWTIFRGRPVIMPTVRTTDLVSPITLADCDFTERLRVRKSGARLMNDVMVKSKNFTAIATRQVADLRLQAIVNLDDLFGANNTRLAAEQLVARRAANQLQVIVPGGATIQPDAPVTINDLMPGAIFPIATRLAGGVKIERRLEKIEVTDGPNGERVAATFGPVPGAVDADESGPDL